MKVNTFPSAEKQIRLNLKQNIQCCNFRAGRTFRIHLFQLNSFTDEERDAHRVIWLESKHLTGSQEGQF